MKLSSILSNNPDSLSNILVFSLSEKIAQTSDKIVNNKDLNLIEDKNPFQTFRHSKEEVEKFINELRPLIHNMAEFQVVYFNIEDVDSVKENIIKLANQYIVLSEYCAFRIDNVDTDKILIDIQALSNIILIRYKTNLIHLSWK